jgi:predicted amidophosphoribosyltransferase
MPRLLAAAHAVVPALNEALTFWLPLACAGCGALDVGLCTGCRRALAADPFRRRTGSGLAVTSAVEFSGVPARVLRALKEEGRTSLARAFAPALAAVLTEAAASGSVVTTVPSSRVAYRRRGYRPVDLLVRRSGWRPVPLLRVARTPRDQRGLGRAARHANVGGAFVSRPVTGHRVVLVDDVITTGATLDDAARALRVAGASEIVAVTLAHTPRRRASSNEPQVIRT